MYNLRSTLFCPDGICQKPNGLNSVEFVNKRCLQLTSFVFMSANYIPLSKLPYLRPHVLQYHSLNLSIKFPSPGGIKTAKLLQRIKKHGLKRARRTRSPLDILIFKRFMAKARKVILEAKQSTWRSYCTSINSNIKLSTVWTTIKKFSGL